MQLTYKFRLYPTREQQTKLLWTLDKCRFTYNKLLEMLGKHDKINRNKLQHLVIELKEEFPELKNVYSKVLQYENYRLFSNLKTLLQLKKNGKKVGKLRFKDGWLKTFVYNQSGFKIISGKRFGTLHLSKIGNIPIRLHRKIEGRIKQVIIKRYNSNKWFACTCVEKEVIIKIKTTKSIGIDVGIKRFLSDSEGRQIENPMFYEKSFERIGKECRKLSRKKKGSKNYNKQRIKLAKAYEKLTNQRNDFLHKLSRFYVNNYDLIVVEDLDIRNMIRNRWLASKISNASWGYFFRMLSYKAESAGKTVIKIDPRGTSKEHKFGEIDKDYNASLNILMRGFQQVGMGQPELTPVETRPIQGIPASFIIETGSPLRHRNSPLYLNVKKC